MRAWDLPHERDEFAIAAEMVIDVTSRTFDVSRAELLAKSRSQTDIAFARQVAMYLVHVVFGLSFRDTGDAFRRERTTVAYACSLVEDKRDDLSFDRKLDAMEDGLRRLWAVERLRRVRSVHPLSEAPVAA
ncbi:MAG: helix-turn-helix domain-containing protein [Pseudomonadota bacterium]